MATTRWLRWATLAGLALHLAPAPPWRAPPRGPVELVPTDRGLMDLEREYLPGVVDCELAHFTAAPAALDAQAIAARTYLRRYQERRGPQARVPTGPAFQCWRAPVHERSRHAARRTAGLVLRWRGRLINGNYAAGTPVLDDACRPAPPAAAGLPAPSWTRVAALRAAGARFAGVAWTEIYVTDNSGRRGAAVTPTTLGNFGPPNRGALGQHRSICQAERLGWSRDHILRFFYGADVDIVHDGSPAPGPAR